MIPLVWLSGKSKIIGIEAIHFSNCQELEGGGLTVYRQQGSMRKLEGGGGARIVLYLDGKSVTQLNALSKFTELYIRKILSYYM